MKAARALAAVVVAGGLAGCAATFWWGKQSTTLGLGMSKQQVRALLGSPRQVMTQQLQGVIVETWTYLDRTLTFQQGALQSWGSLSSSTTP